MPENQSSASRITTGPTNSSVIPAALPTPQLSFPNDESRRDASSSRSISSFSHISSKFYECKSCVIVLRLLSSQTTPTRLLTLSAYLASHPGAAHHWHQRGSFQLVFFLGTHQILTSLDALSNCKPSILICGRGSILTLHFPGNLLCVGWLVLGKQSWLWNGFTATCLNIRPCSG